ncbi:ATS12-like protein [Mya arenaria]|uniref:ATS12-like protein n=1 Tax=Mya arenaria TaxID=6604 RepID=A0ABY7G8E0_MYAAR|nr:ATS12-like protein [Mya arenaria]
MKYKNQSHLPQPWNGQVDYCAGHGGWSDWESWSACPVTCDVGLRSRQRFCNNPFPSMLGQYCQGKSDDYTVCNTKPCKSEVAFNAHLGLSVTVNKGDKVVFDSVLLNSGDCYNASTGIFAAPLSGIHNASHTTETPQHASKNGIHNTEKRKEATNS